VHSIKINEAATMRLAAYSVILMFLGGGLFSFITSQNSPYINSLGAILVYFLAVVAHELIHGLFFKLFGGKPTYGAGVMCRILPYFYATAGKKPYSYRQMAVVALAPLFILCIGSVVSAIVFPSTVGYALVVFVGNFAGAVGDLWLLSKLRLFRKLDSVHFVDTKNSIDVYSTNKLTSEIQSYIDKENAPSNGNNFSKLWFKSFIVVFIFYILSFPAISLLAKDTSVIIGPSWFPLLEVNNTPDNIEASFNFLSPIIISFLFAAIYSQLLKRRIK